MSTDLQPYHIDPRDSWTLVEKELFVKVNTEILPETVDAVVWIEGDSDDRVQKTLEVFAYYNKNIFIILSGGLKGNPYRPDKDTNPDGGNIPSWEIKEKFVQAGVPEEKIILEEASLSAKDQSINVIALAKEKALKKIVLVASPWHQLRLFLTFLKQVELQNATDIEIINQPEIRFSLERSIPGRGKNSFEMLKEDLGRITKYTADGPLVTAEEGLKYLEKWEKKYGEVSEHLQELSRSVSLQS